MYQASLTSKYPTASISTEKEQKKFNVPFAVHAFTQRKTVSLIVQDARGNNEIVPFALSMMTPYEEGGKKTVHTERLAKSTQKDQVSLPINEGSL